MIHQGLNLTEWNQPCCKRPEQHSCITPVPFKLLIGSWPKTRGSGWLAVADPEPRWQGWGKLEWCTGFCPALHTGWISAVTYYDRTVKHIILAACEPWHGGLDSNPRYVVTHHPISWRSSPLGIHGGAPYYRIFFWWPFMALSAASG